MSGKERFEVAMTDFIMDMSFWLQHMEKWSYLIAGEEICPTTGKKHWQMAGKCKNPRTWNGLMKELKPRNVNKVYEDSTLLKASTYCKKDGKIIFEHGELPNQGKRVDLDDVHHQIIVEKKHVGKLVRAGLIANFQQLRYAEGLMKYQTPKSNIREPPFVMWRWGDTDTSKSHYVFTTEDVEELFRVEPNCVWYDGYMGQEAVIFDDYRGNIPFGIFLQILDKYQLRLQVKGSFIMWEPKRIYITSSKRPEDVYKNCGENIGQLLRRITEIVHCTEKWNKGVEQKSGVILDPDSVPIFNTGENDRLP